MTPEQRRQDVQVRVAAAVWTVAALVLLLCLVWCCGPWVRGGQ